jgi:adenylate cyclase
LPLLDKVIEALGAMTRQIVKYDGIISDFQGDAVLGFWGWPMALVDGPLPACQAALAVQAFFSQAALTPEHSLAGFRIGIGIGHGRAVAGRIGSDEQVKIGVFGPPVNLGARLESLTKQLRVSILIDEPTADMVRSSMPRSEGRCRRLGRVRPYGMSTSLMVSELLPPVEQFPAVSDGQIADFETAVEAVGRGDWPRAREILKSLPDGDGPREFLLRFLEGHRNALPADWDGVIPLAEK